jgi:hypothetical protein
MSPGRRTAGLSAGAGLLALMLGAGQGVAYGAKAGDEPRPPKVLSLSYYEGGDTSPLRDMSVVARHANSVKFATRFDGERASAPGRHISGDAGGTPGCRANDPPRNLPPRCRPWHPIRRHGGSEVIQLTDQSLDETGEAKIRIRARRKDQVDDIFLVIVDAECGHDPPIYPRTCRVNRHSESTISP